MTKEAKIALGTWSWGTDNNAGGDYVFGNHLGVSDLKEVFTTALANGLNLFDTAYAYSYGNSERTLGQLVNEVGRDKVVISDKFTPGMQNDAAKNPVVDMLEGSLDRLGTDFIDIYWIHNSADVERWTPLLVDAVKTGKIGRVGVSNHSLSQVKRVQEILAPYGIKVSAVQNHFSLLYRNSIDDGLLAYCKENDIQFFSYMVLEQGALSGKYDQDHPLPAASTRGKTYNPLFPVLQDLLTVMRKLAAKYNASPAQIATAWAIGKGTTPILGVTKVAQVTDAATASKINLTAAEVTELEQAAKAAGVDTRGGWEGQA